MLVQSLDHVCPLNDHWSKFSLIQDFEQFQDQNQNGLVLLLDQLVDQNWDDVKVDYGVYSKSELGHVDHNQVGVCADLNNFIIEEFFDLWDNLVFDKDVPALL